MYCSCTHQGDTISCGMFSSGKGKTTFFPMFLGWCFFQPTIWNIGASLDKRAIIVDVSCRRCGLPESLFRQQFNAPLKIAIGSPRPETGAETLLFFQKTQTPPITSVFWCSGSTNSPPKKKNKPDLFPEIWNLPNSRRLLLLITLSELMRVFLKRACGIYLSDQRSWTWQESRPSISFKTNWVKNTRSCLESKQSKTFRISGISKHNQQILHDEQKVSLTICIPWLSWISRPSLNNFDDTNEGAPLRSCDTR